MSRRKEPFLPLKSPLKHVKEESSEQSMKERAAPNPSFPKPCSCEWATRFQSTNNVRGLSFLTSHLKQADTEINVSVLKRKNAQHDSKQGISKLKV